MNWMNFLIRSGIRVYRQQQRDRARRERAFIRNSRKAEQVRLRDAKENARLQLRQKHMGMHTLLDKEIAQLSAEEFEMFVAALFENEGWHTSLTPRGGDMGVDINMHIPDGDKHAIVQCKKWTGSVGQPVVRDLYGVMNHLGATEGYIVTSSNFTPAAIFFAEGKPIHLIGGEELLERMRIHKEQQRSRPNRQEASQKDHIEVNNTQSAETTERDHLLAVPVQNDQLTLSPQVEAYFRLLLKSLEDTRRRMHDTRTQQEQNPTSHTRYINSILELQQLASKVTTLKEIINSIVYNFSNISRFSIQTSEDEVRKHFMGLNEGIGSIFAQLEDVDSIGTINPSIREILGSVHQCCIALVEDLDDLFALVEGSLALLLESPNAAAAGRVVQRLPNGELAIGIELSTNFSSFTEAVNKTDSLLHQKATRAATGCLLPVVLFLLLAGILTLIVVILC